MRTSVKNLDRWIFLDRECPEYDWQRQICKAAIGYMVPNIQQQMCYCGSCDYDNCPVYLGKALRTSLPQGLDRESLMASGK